MIARTLNAWPPLPPGAWLRPSAPHLPFPLDDPRTRRFRLGRVALWHGVRALGLRAGDEILVPAYHHGSEIQALIAAGLITRFYGTQPGLIPDLDELDALVSPRTRALLLIHVLGLSQSTTAYRRWCDERKLLLLEDAAQGWLAETEEGPAGWQADLALFCLYKTFGVPDGAALRIRRGEPGQPSEPEPGIRAMARAHSAWVAQRWSLAGAAWNALHRRRDGDFDLDAEIALGDTSLAMSSSAARLLPKLTATPAAAIRRAHYRMLLERLAERVPAEIPSLPPGAAPFAFPIWADDKERVLEGLARAGIQALNFWSAGHPSLDPSSDPVSARLRRHVVGLPVHQELEAEDLDRIATAIVGERSSPPRDLAVTDMAGFDAPGADWGALAERSGNVFATPEWLGAWWRHLGRGELDLRQCRTPTGRLMAVFPMVRERAHGLRLLRFCSADVGDELGPICAPADEPAVARAWRQILDSGAGDWDLALAERLPGRVGWPALGRLDMLRREASPVLSLGGLDWEGFVASRSRNFRQQLRRFERRLARGHGLRFRLAEDQDRLQADLDTLIALHRARWQVRRVDAFVGPREAFHREFARIALERGWLRLWFAELNGTPAAAWYGFRYAGMEWYYNAGRDPAFEHLSVGVVLMAHTVREAIRDGQRQYRLLLGDEEYKRRWATHDPGLDTAADARSALGQTALAALSTAFAAPPAIRWRLRAVGAARSFGRRGPAEGAGAVCRRRREPLGSGSNPS